MKQKFGVGLSLALTILASGCGVAANSHNMTGVNLFQNRNYLAARQSFQKAITAAPESADGYYNLASTQHKLALEKKSQGQKAESDELFKQAEDLYNHALDKDKNHDLCYRALAVLLVETDRSEKAFTLLRSWLRENPSSSEARDRLAQLYMEFGQNDEANHYLQESITLNPRNNRAINALAKLREESGDISQAIDNYQRSLQIDANQPVVAQQLASLQRRGIGPGAAGTANNATPNRRY